MKIEKKESLKKHTHTKGSTHFSVKESTCSAALPEWGNTTQRLVLWVWYSKSI